MGKGGVLSFPRVNQNALLLVELSIKIEITDQSGLGALEMQLFNKSIILSILVPNCVFMACHTKDICNKG